MSSLAKVLYISNIHSSKRAVNILLAPALEFYQNSQYVRDFFEVASSCKRATLRLSNTETHIIKLALKKNLGSTALIFV